MDGLTTLCAGCGTELDEAAFVDHAGDCAEPTLVVASAEGAEILDFMPARSVPLVA
jgi:hypothetical protein